MALKLKEIDFKQLMFQKGDRIALIAAAAFMGLLIIFGFFINGLGSGTASANAEELAKLREAGKNSLVHSTPPPNLKDIDPELMTAGVLSAVDPGPYATANPYFTPSMLEDSKWRLPEVLVPDEFQVDLIRGLARTYVIDFKRQLMKFIRDKKPKGLAAAGARGGNKFRGLGGRLGGMGGAMGGGMGDTEAAGAMGGMGAMDMGDSAPVTPKEFVDVPLDRVAKGSVGADLGEPAEATLPLRMPVIQASFPLKKQMEEFKRALRFPTLYQMENEIVPEFMGLIVKRRAYRIGSPNKVHEDWKELNLLESLRKYLVIDAEPEDPKLMMYGMVWPRDRLVIPRPQLARDLMYPEPKMPGLTKVVEEFDKAANQRPIIPPPKTRLSKGAGFDEFEAGMAMSPAVASRMGGMMGDEEMGPMGRRGQMVPGAPGSMPGGGMGVGPGGMVPGSSMLPGGVMPPMGSMPGMPGQPGMAGPGMAGPGVLPPGMTPQQAMMMSGAGGYGALNQMQQDRVYPEKALLRFEDPTVQPGFIYEYQLTIKMANPLFGKTDKAIAKGYTTEKEIGSTPVTIKQKLVVPEEFDFYMVTEDRRRSGANNGTWVQIHRWLDTAYNDWRDGGPSGTRFPVGDWSIVEQIPAFKGEYIGRIEDTEVPMWWALSESFIFASRPDARRIRQRGRRGVPIDFNTQTVLIDFQGGPQQKYTPKSGSSVEDNSELNALVLTRDGRLVLRSSLDDTENKDRKDRVDAWRKWTKEVRDAKEGVRFRQMNAAGAMDPGMGSAGGRDN